MSKRFSTIVVVILVCAFLFANLNVASAQNLPGPTITPFSGDAVFSTEVIGQVNLPGTTTYGSLIVPVGYPTGEKQFEGDGIVLSGLEYGYVNACFSLKGVAQGWGGQVGYWDGKAWQLQATTFSTPQEASYTLACAKVYQNGTYALIKWVTNTALLPKSNNPNCNYKIKDLLLEPSGEVFSGDGVTYFSGVEGFYFYSDSDLTGKHVTLTFKYADPTGGFLYNNKSSNVLLAKGPIENTIFDNVFTVAAVDDLDARFYYSMGVVNIYYTLDFGNCVQTIMVDTGMH